jgi:quercetin dioxygenase-like cupin family protein
MLQDKNIIFAEGEPAWPNVFTGTAWLNTLISDDDDVFNCQVFNVVFEPCARNNWHSHPGGQILLVTDGEGYHQIKGETVQHLQKGDVVSVAPDVVHWHGATLTSSLTHIAISPNKQKGPINWLEPITDEQYNEIVKNDKEGKE